jgi:hypothetical protein
MRNGEALRQTFPKPDMMRDMPPHTLTLLAALAFLVVVVLLARRWK